MGLVKQYLNEQPNYDDIDKLVCTNCIHDDGLIKLIKSNHKKGAICSYCKNVEDEIFVCSLNLVIEHICQSLAFEYDDPNNEVGWNSREDGWQGATVYSTMDLLECLLLDQSNYDVFRDICASIGADKEWCDRDPYLLRAHETLFYGWKNFCSFIKHRCRYFFMSIHQNKPTQLGTSEFTKTKAVCSSVG